jgi:hypothetical protein
MTGEALAQANTGEPFSLRDIVAEGIAELPGGVVEAGKNILEARATPAGTAADPIPWTDEKYLEVPEASTVTATDTVQPVTDTEPAATVKPTLSENDAKAIESAIRGNQLAQPSPRR